MNTNENWITVATFSQLAEAEILKGLLESEGIETFIPEHYLGSIIPMATGMLIRVQVRESFAAAASAIVAEFR